jgi:hypothetical protein
VAGGLGAEHFDGIMMQLLLASSWRVRHLHDVCPFNHAPSLQVGLTVQGSVLSRSVLKRGTTKHG